MKWPLRICSIILTLFWLMMTWLVISVPEDPTTPAGWLLLGLSLLACAGLLFAWRTPRVGGAIAIAAGVVYALVNWIANSSLPPLPAIGLLIAGPFVLMGLLFLLSDRPGGITDRSRWPAAMLAALALVLILAMVLLTFGLGLAV